MKLGELIKEYRDTHDLSQRQFALRCDLSNGYISILEKGINPNTGKPVTPTLPQLKKLADGMSMTLTELFDLIDDIPVVLDNDVNISPVYDGLCSIEKVKPSLVDSLLNVPMVSNRLMIINHKQVCFEAILTDDEVEVLKMFLDLISKKVPMDALKAYIQLVSAMAGK